MDDVSADHAQKTVTIEPFPHSSSLSIASVHPCKHSSVMKKVIERMDGNVRELQRRERKSREGGGGGATTPSSEGEKKSKGSGSSGGKWLGLGRKKDSTLPTGELATTSPADEEEGLRVEQYLLVFLKFISTISTSPLRLSYAAG
jgi:ubiquitin-like-conjugating enzyme ATG3